MGTRRSEFLIVGSGAGGATLARELSRRGKEVVVVERGKQGTRLGTFDGIASHYDGAPLTHIPRKSKEGVIVWRTIMAGGSTIVSCGNGVRSLQKELAERGIDLEVEFAEAETETGAALIDPALLSEGSQAIAAAAEDLGYRMGLMPKFINRAKCEKCGMCVLGCAHGAKWTALDYLREAEYEGAETMYETRIDEVLIEHGKAVGVRGHGPGGPAEVRAKTVIVAAGGIGTPVILQKSGIHSAGGNLFLDLFFSTYGTTKGLNLVKEPSMALVNLKFHESDGFLLSPFVMPPKRTRLVESGPAGFAMSNNQMIGMMMKMTDEASGRVYPDGSISKGVTQKDWTVARKGNFIAREIIVRAGADPKSIVISNPSGAHPGGTAAIGAVVDSDLQTKVDGLFVCDASVLPVAPGLPPILTIVALAKRLGKTLAA